MSRLGNNIAGHVSICTLGCKVNQYESAQLSTLLVSSGYTVAMGEHQGANLYVVHTCTVTSSTDAQSRQLVNRIIRLNPGAFVLVTGCYAQVAPDVFRAIKGVNGVLGQADMGRMLQYVDQLFRRQPAGAGEAHSSWPIPSFPHRSRVFVKVQDGCDGGCSYCIIPRARGPSRSRSPGAVIKEVQALASQGHREVVITGVHLGLYGRDLNPQQSLAGLLSDLGDQSGVTRLRISSLEPMELSSSIVEWLVSCPLACPHFHISLQSGDNGVLRQMNRRYNADEFRDMVRELIWRVPDLAVGVDVMGGFPGEDEAAFQRTYRLLEDLPLAYFHVFPFSPRPGTPAAHFSNKVEPARIRQRCSVLRQLGKNKRENFARRFLGRCLPVLVESRRDPASGMLRGFTHNYIQVKFPGPDDWMNREIGVIVRKVHDAQVFGYPAEKSTGERTYYG